MDDIKRNIKIKGKYTTMILAPSQWALIDKLSNNDATKWIVTVLKDRPKGYSMVAWVRQRLLLESIKPEKHDSKI